MIESFVHSDYQIPEITRKLTLAQERASYPSSMPNISSRMCARWACSTRYE